MLLTDQLQVAGSHDFLLEFNERAKEDEEVARADLSSQNSEKHLAD